MRRMSFAIMLFACLHTVTAMTGRCDDPQPTKDRLTMRYGERADLASYPQKSPKESLASVVKAIKADKAAYLLAHLVWPAEVDKQFGGDREKLLKLASRSTPGKSRKLAAALNRHLSEGKWTIGRHTALSQIDGLPDATLSRLGNRWFMHNVPGE